MQIISNTALISINETLVVQLILFLVFIYVMNRIMFRPLKKAMSGRNDYFDRIAEEVQASNQKLESWIKELEIKQQEVKQEAFAVTKTLEEAGKAAAAELFEATQVEITTLRDEADVTIQKQIKAARAHLQEESAALAVMLMEKVLDRRLAA